MRLELHSLANDDDDIASQGCRCGIVEGIVLKGMGLMEDVRLR